MMPSVAKFSLSCISAKWACERKLRKFFKLAILYIGA